MRASVVTRLNRLNRVMSCPVVWTPDAALMASVIDKARRTLAGERAERADWSHVGPIVKAHRERLLKWAEKGQP